VKTLTSKLNLPDSVGRLLRLVRHLFGLPSPERIEARKLAQAQHEFFFREACKAFAECQDAFQNGDMEAFEKARQRHRTACLRHRSVVIPPLFNDQAHGAP
jgi:hypothetical protein